MEDISDDEAHARFLALVRGADPGALQRVADAWSGKTTREASIALNVTEATLRNWRDRLPELRVLLLDGRALVGRDSR